MRAAPVLAPDPPNGSSLLSPATRRSLIRSDLASLERGRPGVPQSEHKDPGAIQRGAKMKPTGLLLMISAAAWGLLLVL